VVFAVDFLPLTVPAIPWKTERRGTVGSTLPASSHKLCLGALGALGALGVFAVRTARD
jgi:hypothetical protein